MRQNQTNTEWLLESARWLLALTLLISGCKTEPVPIQVPPPAQHLIPIRRTVTLAKGDVIEVSYFKSYSGEGLYRLDVNDKLRISVVNRPELTHEAIVLPDATCTLPAIGTIHVKGKTAAELQLEITERYAPRFDSPQVDVLIIRAQGRMEDFFSILKESPQGPVREAIITAEGVLELPLIPQIEATGRTLAEVRQSIVDEYGKVMPGLRTTVNLLRREEQLVTVLGEVHTPGGFSVTNSMTAMRVLALAGGVTDRAWLSQVLIVHPHEDGSLTVDVHDLQATFDGIDTLGWLTYVSAEDVVYVPKSPIADANIFIEQYIRNMIPLRGGVGVSFDLSE